jgi:hypothetical protein
MAPALQAAASRTRGTQTILARIGLLFRLLVSTVALGSA